MNSHLVLTVDIGTSSCKVCIFDNRGEILKTSKREYPAFSPAPGFAEQNPEQEKKLNIPFYQSLEFLLDYRIYKLYKKKFQYLQLTPSENS